MGKRPEKPVELPFTYVKYAFEFNPVLDEADELYFKFGYNLGERVPTDSNLTYARNPGYYGPYAKFIKDRSISACLVRRDQLDGERASISSLVRVWESIRAEARKEAQRAEDTLQREEGLLYVWGGGSDLTLNSMTGAVKKTVDSLKWWARTQPSYLEAKEWVLNATAQYEYVDGVYKNLVHTKAKMLMSLASDEREQSRLDHGEV